jgi:hypothetical protein
MSLNTMCEVVVLGHTTAHWHATTILDMVHTTTIVTIAWYIDSFFVGQHYIDTCMFNTKVWYY